MSMHAEDSRYALLTDGVTIEIRAARSDDFDAVRDLHAKMSPDNLYLRFFSMSPLVAEQEARRVCREPGPDHAALLAVLDDEVVGCGTYEQAGTGSRSAEVAFTVADDLQNRGIGMLLLEHLVSLARGRGFGAFTAETLSENAAMLRVFADAGLQAQRSLAVGAVPAGAVLGVAEDCGRRGVGALAVVAAGLPGPARAELLEICRRHSMRMVGPASFGVANPGIRLDATFSARHPAAGTAGLALQSTGGTGFVLVEHLSRLGVGISSLFSFGDKDDVSGTDLLQWWESDGATKLALLYLESIGNPPKFARTARRVGRTVPVLTVDVGRSVTGKRLAGARAARAATPLVTRRALFEQAGIIAAADLGELLDAAALLAAQPVPAGNRVGVVSNTRGGVVLAADACGDAGMPVATLAGDTQRALRDMLGRQALVAGPVDTTVLVT